MKNLLVVLLLMILFSFEGNAQKKKKSEKLKFKGNTEAAYISVKTEDEIVKYKFDTIKDFEENSNKILDTITTDAQEKKTDSCEITVEISVTVTVELESTTVSGTITTSCAAVAEAVKELRAELITTVD
jgi:hypothetical protein